MSAIPPTAPAPASARSALAAQARLARTVNISQDLGAPLERGWCIDIQPGHLAACAESGFTAIRLPVCLAAHRTSAGMVETGMLRRVEKIVDDARTLGLAVVVANHRDPELMADPEPHRGAVLASTGQLARALSGRGGDVVIEPLTEPCQALNPMWNTMAAELISAVRAEDPDVTLLLGPCEYSNPRFLSELMLPDDERNLIVGIHHYWPITFTMQGETFLGEHHLFGDPRSWLGTTWNPAPENVAEFRDGFAQVATWGKLTGRPLFIAEFGTTNKADLASRARWTRFNRMLAEAHGMPWAVWSFAPTFAIYDLAAATFIPELLAALMDRTAISSQQDRPGASGSRLCRVSSRTWHRRRRVVPDDGRPTHARRGSSPGRPNRSLKSGTPTAHPAPARPAGRGPAPRPLASHPKRDDHAIARQWFQDCQRMRGLRSSCGRHTDYSGCPEWSGRLVTI